MKPFADMATRWPRLSELLDQAFDVSPAERAAWLEALQGEPAEVKDTLRRLLKARAVVATDDFLSALPRLDKIAPGAAELREDVLIGPYRLVRQLGHGGMGSVWLAERSDGQLKRHVALKLPHVTWDGNLAERLARERDILASLEHPNIARLYDAGVDALGRPWMAMEFVQGHSIDGFALERGLDVPARLALLLQVCAAVAYAHSRLVIHRDLKPSNILVTDDGQVRLLDFGIAKIVQGESTEATALTQAAGRALTPDYASPEQVRGEALSTASDVYGMGVVAYLLLSGQQPYRLKRGSAAELEEAIADADPPRASAVAHDAAAKKQLRGDLDAILAKALEKDPARRYPTMTALADDLQRHLGGHAVLARPIGAWLLARKFVRRNRLGVAGASAIVMALSVGLGTAWWQKGIAEKNVAYTERGLYQLSAVRVLYTETVSAMSGWDAVNFGGPGSVGKLLKQRADALQSRFKDRPNESMAVLQAVAVQLGWIGDQEGALEYWRRHHAEMMRVGEATFDRSDVLENYVGIGRSLRLLGRYKEAGAVLRDGLALAPAQEDGIDERVQLSSDLANVLARLGQHEEAQAVLGRATAELMALNPRSKRAWDLKFTRSRLQMGVNESDSVRLAREALAGFRAHHEGNQSDIAATTLMLGTALAAAGHREEAETTLRQALALNEEAHGRTDRDSVLAAALLAQALAADGRFDDASRRLAQYRTEVKQLGGPAGRAMLLLLDAFQLDLEVQRGDTGAARHFVRTEPLTEITPSADPERMVYVAAESQWLRWQETGELAEQRLLSWLDASDAPDAETAETSRARLEIAASLLARQQHTTAAAQLDVILERMRQRGADRTWAYRRAVEYSACAHGAAGGDAAVAAQAQLDAFDRDDRTRSLRAPTKAEHIDSVLRRARILLAAGRKADAVAMLDAALPDLASQHSSSPRRITMQRLRHQASSP